MASTKSGEPISMTGRLPNNSYGFELILDLKGCDPNRFNRSDLSEFFRRLCAKIDMQLCEIHFWDDVGVADEEKQTLPHTKGTSAVCFILTSSIVIHTLDLLKSAYVNIFSCKQFDPALAETFTKEWFGASSAKATFIERT